AQHTATAEQFSKTLEEKNQRIIWLELNIKRLLKTVRGSRQERINPNQILLFSLEELKELADELEKPETPVEPPSEEDAEPSKNGKKRSGRRRLPTHLPREVLRHE
ncbi:MAG: hypothetical protein ACK53L_02225, partial [Pirellulaceae bacterium]